MPLLNEDKMQKPPAQQSPLKITKSRSWVSAEEYESTLNLVRNTLKIDESEALKLAGYSSQVSGKWRKDNRFPLLAVNALKGLLLGHQLAKQEVEGKPLTVTLDELIVIAGALDTRHKRLRAALYREIAKRCDEQ